MRRKALGASPNVSRARAGRGGLLVGGLLALVLLCTEGPAFGAYPGFNGSLVFTSESNDAPSVYGSLALVSPNGGRERFLRANAYVADTSPSFSPDGSWIAYSRTNYGPGSSALGIWRMRPDGSSRTQLVSLGDAPTWSPDGSRIAYIGYSDGYGVYTMNADGSEQTKIPVTGNLSPENLAWSPDGTQIAVSDAYGGIVVIAPTGGTPTMISGGRNPSWAPDGTKIAFTSYDGGDSEIAVMNADGTGVTPLTANAVSDDFAAWSPDGRKIAFETESIYGYSALAVMNADGSGVKLITNGYEDHTQPDWQPLPLTLAAGKGTVDFGRSVRLSGRLFWSDTANRTVSLYAIPHGERKRLIRKLTLNSAGEFAASVSPRERTTYVAQWSGDADHPAASRSLVVSVRARIKTWLAGFFAVAGRYKLFHFGDGVRQIARVKPNHAGQRVHFAAQRRINGRWRDVADGTFRLGPRSTVTAVFGGSARAAYRAHAIFLGDADHARATSAWVYFKLV